jgi:hypothetical protein
VAIRLLHVSAAERYLNALRPDWTVPAASEHTDRTLLSSDHGGSPALSRLQTPAGERSSPVTDVIPAMVTCSGVPEIVTFPEEIDIGNADSAARELRAAIRPGVAVVIADILPAGLVQGLRGQKHGRSSGGALRNHPHRPLPRTVRTPHRQRHLRPPGAVLQHH